MMMRGVLLATAAAVIAAASSASAKRSGPTKRDIEEHACYNDAMTLCREFVPDEKKITACMEQKRASLSPPCAALFNPDSR